MNRYVILLGLLICAGPAARADDYLDRMAAEPGAVTTASGLVYRELEAGTGPSPAADSVVRAHYEGRLADGTVFDSSLERGAPLVIPLQRVIACWQEGIRMMKVGGRSRLTCPARIAYGDRGVGPIPPGATLSFDVQLLGIEP